MAAADKVNVPEEDAAKVDVPAEESPVEETGMVVLSGSDLKTALAGASHADKLKALRGITSYTGAPTEKIDSYLGQRLLVLGAVIQRDATVRVENPQPNPITGEIQEYDTADRCIWKIQTADNNKRVVAFMSMAITGFTKNILEPCFGAGDYAEPVPVKIMQTAAKKGRSYNVQIVE